MLIYYFEEMIESCAKFFFIVGILKLRKVEILNKNLKDLKTKVVLNILIKLICIR